MRGDIRRERDAIAALRAEWATLDNPARIQGLVRRHLPLRPTEPTQFDSLDRLAGAPAADRAAAAGRRDRLDDRESGQRSADRLRTEAGPPPARCRAGTTRPWTRSRNPQTRRSREARRALAPAADPHAALRRATSTATPRRAPASGSRSSPSPLVYAVIAGRLVMFAVVPESHVVRRAAAQDARRDRAARHPRPQRRDPRDRRAHAVAVRRAAPHHRSSTRRPNCSPRCCPISTPPNCASGSASKTRLRLAQARDHAEAAAGDPPARPARRRLPARRTSASIRTAPRSRT